LLQSHPIIIVFERIGTGGMTQAAFTQARMLMERGFSVYVATVTDERPVWMEWAHEYGRWPEGLGYRNIVDDLGAEFERVKDQPKKLRALQLKWLTSLAKSFRTRPILIAEHRFVIPLIQHLPSKVAARVGFLHDNQFTTQRAKQTVMMRPDREQIFGGLWSLNALVGLTGQQVDHMKRIAGPWRSRIFSAPNEARLPDGPLPDADPKKIAVVSRLVPRKQVHEIIHAFAEVVKKLPDVRMDVYGGGAAKQSLIDLTEELGLGDRIEFMGTTQEPFSAMATGLFSAITSWSEAMPLTILESFAVGRPVIAYSFLYGPGSMIDEGETGFIVPYKDRHALAEKMIYFFERPELALEMGAAARERVTARYSREAIFATWEIFLAAALETKAWRMPLWMEDLQLKGIPVIAAVYRLISRGARRKVRESLRGTVRTD
jgi:poly(glycerol-phosphate) alpha-glucosyltransferase